jgi:hypothetical protein
MRQGTSQQITSINEDTKSTFFETIANEPGSLEQLITQFTHEQFTSEMTVQVDVEARRNTFQDINAGPDSCQIIVSTAGALISARRIAATRGTTQFLGQMSDSTLQQLACSDKERHIQKSHIAGKSKQLRQMLPVGDNGLREGAVSST